MTFPGESHPKPPCHRADALAVLVRLRKADHMAYFAGGCVRDALLGLPPKDWDIATDARRSACAKSFPILRQLARLSV